MKNLVIFSFLFSFLAIANISAGHEIIYVQEEPVFVEEEIVYEEPCQDYVIIEEEYPTTVKRTYYEEPNRVEGALVGGLIGAAIGSIFGACA